MNGVGVGSGYRGKERKRALGDKRGGKGGFRKNTPKSLKGEKEIYPCSIDGRKNGLFFTKRTPSFLLEDFLLHQPDRHAFRF